MTLTPVEVVTWSDKLTIQRYLCNLLQFLSVWHQIKANPIKYSQRLHEPNPHQPPMVVSNATICPFVPSCVDITMQVLDGCSQNFDSQCGEICLTKPMQCHHQQQLTTTTRYLVWCWPGVWRPWKSLKGCIVQKLLVLNTLQQSQISFI